MWRPGLKALLSIPRERGRLIILMSGASSAYVAELLKQTGLFQEAQIEVLLGTARQRDERITEVVVREGFVP